MVAFLDNGYVTIAVSIVTLWALFGDDFRVIFGNKETDWIFNILTLICFGIFCVEIILSSTYKDDYINSFFFYLDVISTVTLLFDIDWISSSVFNSSSSGGAAKAAKVGTRATRIIRILRLIRLIRVVKLYKAAQQHREKLQEQKRQEALRLKLAGEKSRMERQVANLLLGSNENMSAFGGSVLGGMAGSPSHYNRRASQVLDFSKGTPSLASPGPSRNNSLRPGNPSSMSAALEEQQLKMEEEDIMKESAINKILSSNINKIVILLIMFIMLSVPLFSVDTYNSGGYSVELATFRQLEQ